MTMTMTKDEAEIIQALIPWVTVQDVLHTHQWVSELPTSYLVDDFNRLTKSIPQMPLIPFLKGVPPVIRNLRTDEGYKAWEIKNGLVYECLEYEMNRHNLFPIRVSRIEAQS